MSVGHLERLTIERDTFRSVAEFHAARARAFQDALEHIARIEGRKAGRIARAALSTESALQRTTPESVATSRVLRPPTPEGGET